MSYLPTVAWQTVVNNVTVVNSTTYTLSIANINPNDPGASANEVQIGYYLKDWIGHTYSITAINVGGDPLRIQVVDDFATLVGPQQGRLAYVYKSVGDGHAPYLAPIRHERLDLSALGYTRPIELDVLWKNLLHLDQTYPQNVINGQTTFDDGLILGATPTVGVSVAGKSYYDANWKCLAVDNGDGTVTQNGQESVEVVFNPSYVDTIENGRALYRIGTDGLVGDKQVTSVGLAKADNPTTAAFRGMSTNHILPRTYGKLTTRGRLNDIDTSTWGVAGNNLYLSSTVAGAVSTTIPTIPNIIIKIGTLDVVSATVGSVNVVGPDWHSLYLLGEQKATQFPGISADTPLPASAISINYTTRVLTITPPLGYFKFYVDGTGVITPFVKVGPVSFPPFTDTSGIWQFHFDVDGNPITTQIAWNNFNTIAAVYRLLWNSTLTPDANKSVTEAWECHLNTISGDDHAWKHKYGSVWIRGGDLFSNLLSVGTPNADGRNAVVSLNDLTVMDDNLMYTTINSSGSSQWEQVLGNNTPETLNATNSGIFDIRYYTSGSPSFLTGTRFPFAFDAVTNIPQYITTTGVRTTVSSGDFFVYYLWTIQDPRNGKTIRSISASTSFGTLALADLHSWKTIQSDFPTIVDGEIRPLYKLTYEVKTSWDVGTKYCVLRKIDDIRTFNVTPVTTLAGSIAASSVTYIPFTGIVSTEVQALGLELYNKFQGTLNYLPKYNATGITPSLLNDDGITPKYGVNTMWHSANDGAGSTLDSDLLDGVQGVNYMRNYDLINNPDYNKTVVGLIRLDNTNINLNSHAEGTLLVYRVNGLAEPVTVYYKCNKTYNATSANALYVTKGDADGLTITPVTFTYNSVKYFGFSITVVASRISKVLSAYTTDIAPFAVNYFNTNTSAVLNAEINGSIGADYVLDNVFNFNAFEIYRANNLNLASIDFTCKGLTTVTAKIGTLAGYLKGTAGTVGAVTTIPESDISFTDITNGNSSTTKHGYLKKLSGIDTDFLDGLGNFTTPAKVRILSTTCPTPLYNGLTTSFDGAYLVGDSTKNFAVNALAGKAMIALDTYGSWGVSKIVSNTSNTFTLYTGFAWLSGDVNKSYYIIEPYVIPTSQLPTVLSVSGAGKCAIFLQQIDATYDRCELDVNSDDGCIVGLCPNLNTETVWDSVTLTLNAEQGYSRYYKKLISHNDSVDHWDEVSFSGLLPA